MKLEQLIQMEMNYSYEMRYGEGSEEKSGERYNYNNHMGMFQNGNTT